MNGQEYNDFLKIRRTPKQFDQSVTIPEEHKQLLIDAVNYAPAQNSTRNFIPILIEDKKDLEWLVKNIFYMVPKYSPQLQRDMPTEYQMQILNAPLSVIYLQANKNLPIRKDPINVSKDGQIIKEPDTGDIDIRNINIGMNMAFLANQAYMLNYDVSFVGCTRGVRTVMDTPELKTELYSMYFKYGITSLATQHQLAPCYAVSIGQGLPLDDNLAGVEWHDGYYNNIKKHELNPIENLRVVRTL